MVGSQTATARERRISRYEAILMQIKAQKRPIPVDERRLGDGDSAYCVKARVGAKDLFFYARQEDELFLVVVKDVLFVAWR